MISISTSTYDLLGHLAFTPDASSSLQANTRRVTRTATLDGGCSITDQGFSDSDRTLDVNKDNISKNAAGRIWYLFRTYSLLNISIEDGFFRGAIQDVDLSEGNLRAKILVKEKLA